MNKISVLRYLAFTFETILNSMCYYNNSLKFIIADRNGSQTLN